MSSPVLKEENILLQKGSVKNKIENLLYWPPLASGEGNGGEVKK